MLPKTLRSIEGIFQGVPRIKVAECEEKVKGKDEDSIVSVQFQILTTCDQGGPVCPCVIDWTRVEGFERNVSAGEASIILPLALRHLTPGWVSFFGLGAVSAAVMSSADSSILASSSMFSRNIYKLAIRPKATEREVVWVLRLSVIAITALSTLVALTVGSVYYLSYLCSDLVYVVLFPQLVLVVFWPRGVNTYGCLASFAAGVALRVSGGEPGIGIPAAIEFPFFDHASGTQRFPFRTAAMLCSLVTHVVVSRLVRALFEGGVLDPSRHDPLGAFAPRPTKDGALLPPVQDGGRATGSAVRNGVSCARKEGEAMEMRDLLAATPQAPATPPAGEPEA